LPLAPGRAGSDSRLGARSSRPGAGQSPAGRGNLNARIASRSESDDAQGGRERVDLLIKFLNAILPIGQRSLTGCGHHLRHWTCEHPCGLAMTALKHSPPEPSPHTSLIVFTGSEPRARPALGTFCPARSCPRCRKPQRPISTSDFLSAVSRSSSSERSPSALHRMQCSGAPFSWR